MEINIRKRFNPAIASININPAVPYWLLYFGARPLRSTRIIQQRISLERILRIMQ